MSCREEKAGKLLSRDDFMVPFQIDHTKTQSSRIHRSYSHVYSKVQFLITYLISNAAVSTWCKTNSKRQAKTLQAAQRHDRYRRPSNAFSPSPLRKERGYRQDAEMERKKGRKSKAQPTSLCTPSNSHSHHPIIRRMDSSQSAVLQVVARHKTRPSTVSADDLRLPPAVVLQAQNSEDVTFAKGQLFRDCGLVHVHGTG